MIKDMGNVNRDKVEALITLMALEITCNVFKDKENKKGHSKDTFSVSVDDYITLGATQEECDIASRELEQVLKMSMASK